MSEKRYVTIGDEIEVALPSTVVTQRLQVAEHIATIRVLDVGVQILNPDGTERWRPVTYAECGVCHDEEGRLYVQPLPAEQYVVTHNGAVRSPRMSENAASRWLARAQPMSTDWATEHAGWAIRRLESGSA